MKLSQSLHTETTKQSQLKVPLLLPNPESLQEHVTIFTEKNGKRYKLSLPLESKSIRQLVLDAASQFNTSFDLKLKADASCYLLYAAKKNGKLQCDYPALEPSQNVMLTKLAYYYLKDKTLENGQTRIKSNFGWERNQEIKTEKKVFCPCLFGL